MKVIWELSRPIKLKWIQISFILVIFLSNLVKQGTEYFLSLSNPPDAIFAVEDFTALGAISKLKERNITIPGQMGIIGFANELFGEHITPSLSTVDQQTIRMGKSALNLLVDIMEKKEQHIKQKVVLDPLLIVRQSSLRIG
jgi:LacI family transcriptional regulator